MASALNYESSSWYIYANSVAKNTITSRMPFHDGILFQFMLRTEFQRSLNLLKTHLHENVFFQEVWIIWMTTKAFYVNMKFTCKKYKMCVHHRQVNNALKIQGWNGGNVEHALDDDNC